MAVDANPFDHIELIEFISDELDDREVPGLGYVLCGADSENDHDMVMQVWPNGPDKPSIDFRLRVTKLRRRR